jgi:hypothetical protein
MEVIWAYQNRCATLQTRILPVDSNRVHRTFPEALRVYVRESGQGVGVEFGLI